MLARSLGFPARVAVGYRLGALGYLRVPGADGSGCFGLLDQIAALEWVRDNVAAFGGDPDRVTVFGESAGAMSIGALLGAPTASGLFHRAILQSGSTHNVHSDAHAGTVAGRFAAAAGVAPDDLDALRALSLDDVLAAQGAIGRDDDGSFGLPWQPVLGSDAVPGRPLEAVRAGAAAGVDLLVGTTLDEMKLFPLISPGLAEVDAETLRARAEAYSTSAGREPGSLLAAYDARTGALPAPDRWLDLLTDLVFRIPAIRLAEAQARHGARVRMYLFAERSDLLGSCHALDLPYTWDNLDAPGTEVLVGALTDERRRLARQMGDAWTSFAAGADVTEMDGKGVPDMLGAYRFESWEALARVRKPIVAAVSGYALGGGLELAMLCDMIVASESAKLGQPEIDLGIMPGAGGTQRLTRQLGKYLAMEVILAGRLLTAQEALQHGLVNRVVPVEGYLESALELARAVAARAPQAVRLAKSAVNRAQGPLQEGLEFERNAFYLLFGTEDQKEGVRAFLEKREPRWRGR